jgi:hypothetical protein
MKSRTNTSRSPRYDRDTRTFTRAYAMKSQRNPLCPDAASAALCALVTVSNRTWRAWCPSHRYHYNGTHLPFHSCARRGSDRALLPKDSLRQSSSAPDNQTGGAVALLQSYVSVTPSSCRHTVVLGSKVRNPALMSLWRPLSSIAKLRIQGPPAPVSLAWLA